MKKKHHQQAEPEPAPQRDDHQQLELLKAVAQAWHGHAGSSRPINEFDAHRRNPQRRPSRFRLQAMNNKVSTSGGVNWDFRQSLWDSYEIVSVSKKLETGLVLDDNAFSGLDNDRYGIYTRPTESKNSLRNLFNQLSSRRFNEADVPREN